MLRCLLIALVMLALAPAARLAWNSRDMPHFGHLHDDSIYFVCAKSLATGAGYRILSLPGRPYQTKYPPLLPALLSVIWRIDPRFPENLQLAMLAMWALLPVYLLASARWFCDVGFSDWGSATLCGVIALSPSLMFYSMTVMSDLLFSCFLLGALLLAERAGNAASRTWLAPAAGLLAVCAYLTKAAALPLIATVPLMLMLRGQRRRAVSFVLVMAPAIVAWMAWVHAHRTTATDLTTIYYTDYFGFQLLNVGPRDLPFLIWKNLDSLFSGIAGLIIFDDGKSASAIYLARFLAIGAILGAVRLGLRRGFTQYHAFAAVYLVMLLVWHYPPNERFVIPVFPLLAAGLASEIRVIAGLVKAAATAANRAVAGGIALALVALAGWGVLLNYQAITQILPAILRQDRAVVASNRVAYEWIQRNAAVGAFSAYDDPVFFLYTGQPAVSFRLAPMPLYYGEREPILRPFHSMADFARRWGLQYQFTTEADFHRELGEGERSEVREILANDTAFHCLYRGQWNAVYQFKATAPDPLMRRQRF